MQDEMYMARAMKLAQRGRFTTHLTLMSGASLLKMARSWVKVFTTAQASRTLKCMPCAWRGEGAWRDGLRDAGAMQSSRAHASVLRSTDCGGSLARCRRHAGSNPQVAGRGLYRLQQEGIDVSHGLMMQDAEAINKGFLKRMRTGFPFIQLKLGASLDGRTAMANGESQWITSPQARRDVQRLRAQSHAILTSSETVLADDPVLTVRWDELNADTGHSILGEPASAAAHYY